MECDVLAESIGGHLACTEDHDVNKEISTEVPDVEVYGIISQEGGSPGEHSNHEVSQVHLVLHEIFQFPLNLCIPTFFGPLLLKTELLNDFLADSIDTGY